jgi:hypothetical protein
MAVVSMEAVGGSVYGWVAAMQGILAKNRF